MNLSKIPTSELLAELDRRDKKSSINNLSKIKRLSKKNNVTLGAQLIVDSNAYDDEMPYIMLGVIDNEIFKDFYYNSGLEYEEFNKYIPDNFHEACESTYEYHSGKNQSKDEYINEAFKILKKCGYVRLENFIE